MHSILGPVCTFPVSPCLCYVSLQEATNKQLSSETVLKCSQEGSGIDKDTIEMKHVHLRSYCNEDSDVSDCTKDDNDKGFVLTDLLSFSWQIAKGMVG